MRAVVQRVTRANVKVEGKIVAEIDAGLLILLGVAADDTAADAAYIANKIAGLRVFADAEGKMNRSLQDTQGSALVVSQFTLYGDVRRGRRPSYSDAAPPQLAEDLYRQCVETIKAAGVKVQQGIFQAMMQVEIHNDGPVTILLDSKRNF